MRSYILRNLLRVQRIANESFNNNCTRVLTYSQSKLTRQFSNNLGGKHDKGDDDAPKNDSHNLMPALNRKYKIFEDSDADIILDVSEERLKISLEDLNAQKEVHDPYADISLNRGTTGVFDIEDLVVLLERDKARNIFVASVPKEYAYVDYIVIVTGKSQKHIIALATFVRKVYKLKRHATDLIPKIEGENSKDWVALDLGNIALHIFSQSAREYYDLETLWTVGSRYDDKTCEQVIDSSIMDQYNAFLTGFQPADSPQ